MPKELHRLLKSHEFLKSAIEQHAHRLSPSDVARLSGNLDTVFMEIVEHASSDPRVTLAQARFLFSMLSQISSEDESRKSILSACQRHFDRLTLQLASMRDSPATKPPPLEYRFLDSLTDRIAIFSADYRYIFTNRANAAFHNENPANFVGRPNSAVIGERFFQVHNKPRFDRCFQGETTSCILSHPGRDPARIYWAKFEPVRNAEGKVDAVMVCSRDVSDLPIPADMAAAVPTGPFGDRD